MTSQIGIFFPADCGSSRVYHVLAVAFRVAVCDNNDRRRR